MPACSAEPGGPPPAADPVRSLEPPLHLRYTAPCNLACFYCYERPHPRRAEGGTLARVEAELRLARAIGYRVVIFGAGELVLLAGWAGLVRLARKLGFEQVWMLSNLVPLTPRRLDRLVEAGLTGVVATLFAPDDRSARQIAGGASISSRQRRVLEQMSTRAQLGLAVHLMLTRPMARTAAGGWSFVRELLGFPVDSLMLSALEPVRPEVRSHPAYTHALDLDWPDLLDRADRAGLFVVLQNIPACLLGGYAHRSLQLRRRVGRILLGWPTDEAQAAFVDRAESLAGRLAPSGACQGCPLVPVCHRYFEPAVRRPDPDRRCAQVVEALLRESGRSADVLEICKKLEEIESRLDPSFSRR